MGVRATAALESLLSGMAVKARIATSCGAPSKPGVLTTARNSDGEWALDSSYKPVSGVDTKSTKKKINDRGQPNNNNNKKKNLGLALVAEALEVLGKDVLVGLAVVGCQGVENRDHQVAVVAKRPGRWAAGVERRRGTHQGSQVHAPHLRVRARGKEGEKRGGGQSGRTTMKTTAVAKAPSKPLSPYTRFAPCSPTPGSACRTLPVAPQR